MNQLIILLHSPLVQSTVIVPLVLILLDAITGIVSAALGHRFQAKYLTDFVKNNVMPYTVILGSIGAAVLAGVPVSAAATAYAATVAAFSLSQLASIVQNAGEATGIPGVTISDVLSAILHKIFPGQTIAAPSAFVAPPVPPVSNPVDTTATSTPDPSSTPAS